MRLSTHCYYTFSGRSSGPPVHAPMDQHFLNFIQFFGKFDKNYILALRVGGLVPPPTEILDPPLVYFADNNCFISYRWSEVLS